MSLKALIFLSMIAGWMNRKQQEIIEYLLEENRVLKEQFDKTGKKLRLDNSQRRQLAKKGKRLGWNLLKQYASPVTPETILAWHRKLIALKYTAKRKINTERQKRMEVIRELCVKFSEENPGWGYGRIQGALENVGYKISTTTVGNILKSKGIAPSPERNDSYQRAPRSGGAWWRNSNAAACRCGCSPSCLGPRKVVHCE